MTSNQVNRQIARLQAEIAYHRVMRDTAACDGYQRRSMAAIDRRHAAIHTLEQTPGYQRELKFARVIAGTDSKYLRLIES